MRDVHLKDADRRVKQEKRIRVMKKYLSLILALVMMASVLAGCGGKEAAPADSSAPAAAGEELTFTTGGSSGTYYAFGSVLAGHVSGKTDSKITAVEGKGSQGNIELMDMEGAQLGLVQSDVMAYAYGGTNLFEEIGKIDCFSTVAALYMEQVQIVTCDPSIKTVADLKGKNVSIGDSGSGVFYNAVDILSAYGLNYETDSNPTYQGFGDSAEALKDGKIDAAFIGSGAPTTAVTELASGKDTYLVSLDDEHIEALREKSPYYSKNIITADTYGLESDVTTVAVGAVVIARDDVAEADVYNFVSSIFEDIDTVTAAHAKGAELDLDFAASVTDVPYHAGAAKYFSEKGYDVPTK